MFGYENGEVAKSNFAAGAALRSVLRIGFGYKGAIFWKMQAGMGDTVFTPLHKIMEKRGVEFAFFHRVESLGLHETDDSIETITVACQATVKAGEFAYDPCVDVNDLACWPSVPNYDQLEEGEALQAGNVNLESFWTPWKGVETKTLVRGVDFDDVVLGISVGKVAYYRGPLVGLMPDPADKGAPRRFYDEVRAHGQEWLDKNSGFLWPDAAPHDNPEGLDWAHLVDISGSTGVERFDTQFFRANIDPSERYVLSLKGSTPYRSRADESGFSNLFLTGDWTRNDFNAGCVEATVMSGLLCSNAMTGYPAPEDIVGHYHPSTRGVCSLTLWDRALRTRGARPRRSRLQPSGPILDTL